MDHDTDAKVLLVSQNDKLKLISINPRQVNEFFEFNPQNNYHTVPLYIYKDLNGTLQFINNN